VATCNLQAILYPLQEWQKKQAETILLTITQPAKLPFFSWILCSLTAFFAYPCCRIAGKA